MRNFDTVVCALDLYPAADRALPFVAALTRGRRVLAELVTVVAVDVPTVSATAELERRADHYGLLRRQLHVIHAASPGSEIVEHVSGRDGALLVMATTAHGGGEEHQLGAVTDEVLQRVRQPVMVVGPQATLSAGCLVVTVDNDGSADAAMPVVERWSATFGGGSVRIVEVQAPDAWPDRLDNGSARDVDRYVDHLGERGIAAVGDVLRGVDLVVSVIDDMEHRNTEMVVVTSPAEIGQRSHWFHTARRLIRFSPRPVLVVPADPRACAPGAPPSGPSP